MQPDDQAKESAKAKLLQAERALDNYVHGPESDYETLKQLLDSVHSARCELFDLLSELWVEGRSQLTPSKC
jgi:hypothetical protein